MSNDKQYLEQPDVKCLCVHPQFYQIQLTSYLSFFMQWSYYYTQDYEFLIR